MTHTRKPCGTEAAYQRHLREQTTPCPPCTRAHRDHRASQRQAARPAPSRTPATAGIPAPTPVRDTTALQAPPWSSPEADLRFARDALVGAIAFLAENDPARLAPLVRELRATLRELRQAAARTAREASRPHPDDLEVAREARRAARAERLRAQPPASS